MRRAVAVVSVMGRTTRVKPSARPVTTTCVPAWTVVATTERLTLATPSIDSASAAPAARPGPNPRIPVDAIAKTGFVGFTFIAFTGREVAVAE